MGKNAKRKTVVQIADLNNHVESGLKGFLKDYPDSDHQRGYLGCLLEVARSFNVGDPRTVAAAQAIMGTEVK